MQDGILLSLWRYDTCAFLLPWGCHDLVSLLRNCMAEAAVLEHNRAMHNHTSSCWYETICQLQLATCGWTLRRYTPSAVTSTVAADAIDTRATGFFCILCPLTNPAILLRACSPMTPAPGGISFRRLLAERASLTVSDRVLTSVLTKAKGQEIYPCEEAACLAHAKCHSSCTMPLLLPCMHHADERPSATAGYWCVTGKSSMVTQNCLLNVSCSVLLVFHRHASRSDLCDSITHDQQPGSDRLGL